MKKKILCMLLLISISLAVFAAKDRIDLNKASLEKILELPISQEQAKAIYDYRTYQSYFKNIYDLNKIESIDQATFLKLKSLVIISHYDGKTAAASRRRDVDYVLSNLEGNEGLQEGFSDIWAEYLVTPRNLNELTFNEIVSFPNVSPVDAKAVIEKRIRNKSIESYRDLRRTNGVRYYGAKNLNNFVYYKDSPFEERLYFDIQSKYRQTYLDGNLQEMYKNTYSSLGQNSDIPLNKKLSYWGYFNLDQIKPEYSNKIKLRYKNKYKAGILLRNNQYEDNLFDNNLSENMEETKWFAGYNDKGLLLKNDLVKFYVGNYRATYGQGLVMENNDFYSSRKTGFGFSKRILGITEDLSSTEEYALKGFAAEYGTEKFNASLFYSNDKKDAVVKDINGDNKIDSNDKTNGKYNAYFYIKQSARFDNSDQEEAFNYMDNYPGNSFTPIYIPQKDIMDEEILGGHLSYSPVIGTSLGFTAYNAKYDNVDFYSFDPENQDLILDEGKVKIPDTEIWSNYSTRNDKYVRDYRRVLGFDWQTVINNTSLQGEYAELSTDGEDFVIGDDPGALVLSSYSQFNDFHFLTIYRDYDLGFDNPYNRGFSEHEKYSDTALDKYGHVLSNPLLQDVSINSVQPQAEKGIYFETRYRITKSLTLKRSYIDLWERKSDARQSVRLQSELEFRPIHPLSLRLKYKNQINRYDDDAERGVSKTSETTGKIRAYLSGFDLLELEYRYTKVWFPPYVYLTNNPDAGSDNIGQATSLIHGDYVGVNYTHNFNENFKVRGGIIYWNNQGASHWDWEDTEIDFLEKDGMKYWFTISDQISDNLYLKLKYKIRNYMGLDYDFRKWWNDPVDEEHIFTYSKKTEQAFRLQIDYKF